jgi:hypothetical protein
MWNVIISPSIYTAAAAAARGKTLTNEIISSNGVDAG